MTTVGVAPPDDELRRLAIASLKRKRKFGEDALAFVLVNGALWLVWALTDRSTGGGMPWPGWVSAIWGVFLVLDAWRAFGWAESRITEADIERELSRRR